jgi:TonB-linked SusC/RagA family outer membrane protein
MTKVFHFLQSGKFLPTLLLFIAWGGGSISTSAQGNISVQGIVTDRRTGEPLIGANILIKGLKTGTVSNLDGGFRIDIPSLPATLSFGYAGYRPEEIDIYEKPSAAITVSLAENVLNEVVVVGYGTQKRSELTGAVASVNTAELQQAPLVSIDQGLGGRASGVQVTQTSGMPGAVASIRIRGTTSLQGGNEPLYVIDGFPVYSGGGFGTTGSHIQLSGLATINPSDIESIDILKDASATAIYGARAANGVVLITTKRGKKGRDNISFETNFGVYKVAKKIELMNAQEYAALINEAYTNDGLPAKYTGTELAEIARLGAGTDWQDEIFRNGYSQDYHLTFSGGDDKTQYALSGNYFNQTGIVIGTQFERYSLRLNLDRKVSQHVSLGVHLSGSQTESAGASGVTSSAMRITPVLPVYEDAVSGIYTSFVGSANPVATANGQKYDNSASRLLGDLYAQWEIIRNLKFKVLLGTDVFYTKANQYTSSLVTQSGRASASIGVDRTINWLNENTLTYDKAWGAHTIALLGGLTLQQNKSQYVSAASTTFVNDVMEYNNLGSGSVYGKPESNAPQWSLLSYLARVNYSLKNRYLLSINGRVDGSSRFGKNNKYGFFPSASAGWKISEETFFAPLRNIVPSLKVRSGYGFTGNTELGIYESLATLGSNSWTIGNQLVSGFYPDKMPNPDLKWEKTGQLDLGIDASFLKNRLHLSVDYYKKITTDLLYNESITAVSGYQTMLKNIGSVQNTGYELSIASDNLTGKFAWKTSFNISFNRNKVLELGGETYKLLENPENISKTEDFRRLIVGQPVGVFWGYRFDGIFQNEDEVNRQTSSISPKGVGLRRYKDLNGDGIVDAANDREVLGDPNPDFFGGLTNTFSYKGFELNVFLQYSYGNELYNYDAMDLELTTGEVNMYKDLVNRWTPDNPSNIYPKATTNRAQLVSDRFVEDASFLKLKSLSLSYRFPFIKSKHIKGLNVYVTGQNLITWTRYRGYDPESSYRGASTLLAGEDYGAYPQARSISAGIKIDY